MTTPFTPAPGSGPDRGSVAALIEELQAPFSWEDTSLWRPYLCAVLYAAVAAIQGSDFFMLFCGAAVVAFALMVTALESKCWTA